jgi:hypothetical protein
LQFHGHALPAGSRPLDRKFDVRTHGKSSAAAKAKPPSTQIAGHPRSGNRHRAPLRNPILHREVNFVPPARPPVILGLIQTLAPLPPG